MALVRRFEDLAAWREARALALEVYRVAGTGRFRTDWALADQIRRAAVSTMNNTAEGFDSSSRVEFARFLRYAARSASEVQSCLYVALDQGYIDAAVFETIYERAQGARRLIRALGRRIDPRALRARPRDGVCETAAPYGVGGGAMEGDQIDRCDPDRWTMIVRARPLANSRTRAPRI
jgi:four helix bundle protein